LAPLLPLLSGSSVDIAPRLLGGLLHGRGVTVRLTEVEAYRGETDPGSHAFRGPTPRTRIMFGRPGALYVYFSYGMHACANIVTSPYGEASAILVRAGEVVDGLEVARSRRPTGKADADLARGPARLCVTLGITLADNGDDLETGPIRLEVPDAAIPPVAFSQGPRTGVSGAGGSDEYPWRFWIPGDPTVSPYKKSAPQDGAKKGLR
jgi:DNA-3-methyladenine glycosylase